MAFVKAFTNYNYICLSTDTKLTNVAVGEVVLETDTGNEYIWDGTAWQEYRMRYKDLGLVIDATNVAAGAIVSMPSYIENCQWVRSIRFMVSTDQASQIGTIMKDTNGIFDVGSLTGNLSVPNTGRVPVILGGVNNANLGGMGSKGFKAIAKNASASVATYLKVYVQLFGE